MALSGTVSGAGILVSKDSEIRKWTTTGLFVTPKTYKETKTEEVREWVALTQAAAEAAVDTATQPAAPAFATYSASEDNRVIGSYKLVKTTTTKTVVEET